MLAKADGILMTTPRHRSQWAAGAVTANKAERDSETIRSGGDGDLALAAAFLEGDPEAAGTITAWLEQATRRYRGRLSNDWNDLVQDLLLEVTTSLRSGGFRGECQLRTYVWRIAHYRCLNRIRDRARRPEHELGDDENQVPDPTRAVLDRLVDAESTDLLIRFLHTVSVDCRRLWTRLLEGRSYREMSRETGISEGALRVRVLRCRQKALNLWKTWLASSHG